MDTRIWKIISDHLGNDPAPYTTKMILDYAAQCNRENAGDPDYTPFDLQESGSFIVDCNVPRGEDGHVVAQEWTELTCGSLDEWDDYWQGNLRADWDLVRAARRGYLPVIEARDMIAARLGVEIKRQRVQQLCDKGDLQAITVPLVSTVRMVSQASIDALIKRGLPDRKGGAKRALKVVLWAEHTNRREVLAGVGDIAQRQDEEESDDFIVVTGTPAELHKIAQSYEQQSAPTPRGRGSLWAGRVAEVLRQIVRENR